MPRSSIWLKTASGKQRKAMCGPACMKIVASFFGVDVSERRIARICKASRITGTTGANIVKGAHRLGFSAGIFDHADFRMIARWLRKGVPVIVDWMSTASIGRDRNPVAVGHYSVVCGLTKTHIILQDPALGIRRKLSRRNFRKTWFDFAKVHPEANDDLIIRRIIVVGPPQLVADKISGTALWT